VIDWGAEGGLHVFCAVLAWSGVRFVRFAADERSDTTLAMLAECFESLGGVPGKVLTDRMGCLKGGVVANVVVPTAQYVRFVRHYKSVPARFLRGRRPGIERTPPAHRIPPGRASRRSRTMAKLKPGPPLPSLIQDARAGRMLTRSSPRTDSPGR
jgi:hypothetical protein